MMNVSPRTDGLPFLLIAFNLLPCLHSQKAYFFTMSPTNTIASLETDAEFNCNTKNKLDALDLKTKTMWSKYGKKGQFRYRISEDGKVLPDTERRFVAKYGATNSTNLIIKNAAFSDAGLYACEQDNPHFKRIVLFMVKESEPACAYEYMDYVQAGDSMLMHCFFTYSAANMDYTPFASFKTGSGRGLETKVTKTLLEEPGVYEIVASSTYKVQTSENGKSVTFYLAFDSQPIDRQLQLSSYTLEAQEPPLWSYKWNPDPMNVTYWATKPTMSPEQIEINIGKTVTCESSANPGPIDYEIKINPEKGESVMVQGNFFKVEEKFKGLMKFECSASSTYKGERKTRKGNFQFHVVEDSVKYTKAEIGGIVSGTIIGVLLAVVGVIVARRVRSSGDAAWIWNWQGHDDKKQEREEEKEEKKEKKEEKKRAKSLEKETKLRKTSSVV